MRQIQAVLQLFLVVTVMDNLPQEASWKLIIKPASGPQQKTTMSPNHIIGI